MFRNLFRILYRPQVTLEELLEEQRHVRSWSATLWLVITNVLVMVLLSVFVMHKITDVLRATGQMPHDRELLVAMSSSFALTLAEGLLGTLVRFALARYAFGWIVQLGLRIVASHEYPRDPEERRAKAKLLRLIHPYTTWMTQLPFLISSLVLTMLVALTPLPDVNQLTDESAAQFAAMIAVSLFLWLIITGLVSFSMWIFMIVVRTSAVQKIYRVSMAQAFWGPFLVYAMIYFVVFLAGGIWLAISLMQGDVPQNDLNFM